MTPHALGLRLRTHKRLPMRHECTHCGKVFPSVKSFDRHGQSCKKKRLRLASLAVTTNPRLSESSTRLSPKRARIGSPNENHIEYDKDDPDDQNIGGLDIGFAHDVSCQLRFVST